MQFRKLFTSQICFGRKHALLLAFSAVVALMPFGETHAQRRPSALGKKNRDKQESAQPPGDKKATPTNPRGPSSPTSERGEAANDEFAPEIVTMEVKREGIQLVATWFPPRIEDNKEEGRKKPEAEPGTPTDGAEEEVEEVEQGKVTSPFILVHDWGRSRNDMLALATFLQSNGHAVIVPDLRGHGASLRVRGSDKTLDFTKFRKADIATAVGDIDQCKQFLQEKNNEGIVNIDLLNVIAVGDSSHLAINWAMTDWTRGPIAGLKQGRDVKSLVLFSPTNNFAGSSLKKIGKAPLISGRNTTPLPMLVVWGGESESAKDCNNFIDGLRKFRPEASKEDDTATRWLTQNLFHLEAPVNFPGYQLAGNPQAKQIWTFANDFVSQKVLNFKEHCPWQIRGADAVMKAREAQE